MIAHKHLYALLLTAIVIGATFGVAAAQRPAQAPGPLFIPVERPTRAAQTPDLGITRSRSVEIDWSALQAARPGQTLQLNLFDDVNLYAEIISVSSEDGSTAWVGRLADDPMAQVFMVAGGGQVAIDVSAPQGLYQVRFSGGEYHAIQQIDQSAYPEEMPPIEIGADQLGLDVAGAEPSATLPDTGDSGGTIDVLVLYTPRARTNAGGETAMRNLVNLAVTETNQSYANSGISQRIRLVSSQEIAYTESGSMSSDLTYLQGTTDAFMNQVHTLRNTYGADLVSLIVEGTQYCGIAFMMDMVSAGFQDYAFSVVARTCATGYYSFAHELGHNMGARHDWYVDTGAYPNTYSHGYVNVSGRWRTIMAYNDECTANGVSCTRLQYWANPNLTRNNAAMGVPAGTSIACVARDKNHPPCDADDHRTLNDTAFTVANFRQSITAPPMPTATPRPLSSYSTFRFLPSMIR